jgi:hypothetical protein
MDAMDFLENAGDRLLDAVGLNSPVSRAVAGTMLGCVVGAAVVGGLGLAAVTAAEALVGTTVVKFGWSLVRKIGSTDVRNLPLESIGEHGPAVRAQIESFATVCSDSRSAAISTDTGLLFVREEGQTRFKRVSQPEYDAAIARANQFGHVLNRIQVDDGKVVLARYNGGKLEGVRAGLPAVRTFEVGKAPVDIYASAGNKTARPEPEPARDWAMA